MLIRYLKALMISLLDTNIWTKKILQEAHYTFSHMSDAEIVIIVTTEDFQKILETG